jgi:hypothetical protein
MVTVFLRGGLGNQMFQYAFAVHLAKKNNTSIIIDTVYLQDRTPRRDFTYRNYDLDIFKLTPCFSRLSRIASKVPIPILWLGMDVAMNKIENLVGTKKLLHEKNKKFDNSVIATAYKNVCIIGYWQSEKYFKENSDEVRKAFQFKTLLDGEAIQVGEKIQTKNSVALHVRRGDYITKKVIKDMGETSISYYQDAIKYIAQHVNNPEFFIFSDDIEWCREHINLSFPTTYIEPSLAGPKASHHLQLMSLCKHNIIANSSFSWWGAWLNKNPHKIVIAPKKWYAYSREGEDDIIPQEWLKI